MFKSSFILFPIVLVITSCTFDSAEDKLTGKYINKEDKGGKGDHYILLKEDGSVKLLIQTLGEYSRRKRDYTIKDNIAKGNWSYDLEDKIIQFNWYRTNFANHPTNSHLTPPKVHLFAYKGHPAFMSSSARRGKGNLYINYSKEAPKKLKKEKRKPDSFTEDSHKKNIKREKDVELDID